MQEPAADLAVEVVGADELSSGPLRSLPQVRTPSAISSVQLDPVGRRAALAGVDDDLRAAWPGRRRTCTAPGRGSPPRRRARGATGVAVVGDHPGRGPAPRRRATAAPRPGSRIDHGRPITRAQQEGLAGARPVEQAGEGVHARIVDARAWIRAARAMERLRPIRVQSDDHDHTTDPRPILVTGGTGKTGRRVADRLEAAGAPVRIGSRRADPPFDWHDPATWAAAVDGVRRRLRHLRPRHRLPRRRRDRRRLRPPGRRRHGVGRARAAVGPRRGRAPAGRGARAGPGADWTIVRCAVFAQNFTEGVLVEPVHRRARWRLPVADVAEPFVDVDDIADVAAAALTDDRHIGQLYEVTGPRLLTFDEAMAEIGAAVGRPVRTCRCRPTSSSLSCSAPGCRTSRPSSLAELFDGDPRRPQRVARRRRAAGPRPSAPRLRRVRPPCRRHRRLGPRPGLLTHVFHSISPAGSVVMTTEPDGEIFVIRGWRP